MPTTELTDDVKRDLHLLKMRHVLDPKRHYRSLVTGNKKFRPKYFQIGTVIAGADEGQHGTLPRKEQGRGLLEELLKDTERRKKLKEKYFDVLDRRKYITKGTKKNRK